MIELPPNSRPELKPSSSTATGSATTNANSTTEGSAAHPAAKTAATNSAGSTAAMTEVNAAKLAQQQVKQNVEAVVLQARLIEQSTTPQKPLYEMLLRVTGQGISPSGTAIPNTANPATPITQITPQVLAALQQGQTLVVKVLAEFPLSPSTRLLATASIDQGVQIQKTDQPALIAAHSSAFKQLIPVQRSLTQLMATLELLAKPEREGALNQSLPGPVRSALQDLTAMLPRANQIREPGYLQDRIRNNGTFLESKLHNLISQQIPRPPASDNLLHSIRNLTQRLLESTAAASTKTVVDTDKTVESAFKTTLTQITGADFKVGLQRLQQALQQASANVQQTVSDHSADPLAQNKTSPTNEAGKQPLSTSNTNKIDVSNKNNEAQQAATKIKDAPVAVPDLQARNSRPHPSMRHYSQGGVASQATIQASRPIERPTSSPITNSATSTQEQYVLPPLPGQVLIQPQARQNLNQKKNDMAQALVSILLSQVKGALARTTLHQLASHTQQTDTSASPTLLSFELPFLHSQQIQVFQFRIEEDSGAENNAEKQYQKRWVVQMGFDIEGMGPMLCQINLAGINASVSFWAEWENTLQHTKSHFDFLQKTLTDMGLKVDKLQGHLGIPANERTLLSNQLVDIRL